MAGTLFPRSYIIERIDARLASLASREAEDTAAVAAGHDAQAALWTEYARELHAWAVKLAANAEAAVLLAEAGTLPPAEVEARVREVGSTERPSDPSNRWQRNSTPSQLRLSERVRKGSVADSRLHDAARERNQLDHVRAYLIDAPVEAFTKTDLRDLNLLGVVAFRLDAPRG